MIAAVGNASNWTDDASGTGEGGAGEGGAGEGGAGTCTDPALNCTPEGRYPVMYPAAYPEVIAVAAMDSSFSLPLIIMVPSCTATTTSLPPCG